MKEITELLIPDDVRYTRDHEWARPKEENMLCGISDYAQDRMGDIVFVELPSKGQRFGQGEQFGTVESVKAVVELFMPVGGEILSFNASLESSPGLVNKDPYHEGWMIEIKPDDPGQFELLLTGEAYLDMLKENK
jgi:glycine cleavage system H protein